MSGTSVITIDFKNLTDADHREWLDALLRANPAASFIPAGSHMVTRRKSLGSKDDAIQEPVEINISNNIVLVGNFQGYILENKKPKVGGFGELHKSIGKIIFQDGVRIEHRENAVKLQHCPGGNVDVFNQDVEREQGLQHENSLPVEITSPVFLKDGKLTKVFVTSYIDGDNLENFLKKTPLTFEQRIRLAFDIASELTVTHSGASASDAKENISAIHKDLKPSNIMCGIDAEGNIKVKIVDFGVASLAVSPGQYRQEVGTPGYMAPEISKDKSYTVKSDIYSFSAVIAQIFGCSEDRLTINKKYDETLHCYTAPEAPFCFDELFKNISKPYYVSDDFFEDIKIELHRYLVKMTDNLPRIRPDSAESAKFLFGIFNELALALALAKKDYQEKIGELKATGAERGAGQQIKDLVRQVDAKEVPDAKKLTYEQIDTHLGTSEQRQRERYIASLNLFKARAEKYEFNTLVKEIDVILLNKNLTNIQLAEALEAIRTEYPHLQRQKDLAIAVKNFDTDIYLRDLLPESKSDKESKVDGEKTTLLDQLRQEQIVKPSYISEQDFQQIKVAIASFSKHVSDSYGMLVYFDRLSVLLRQHKEWQQYQELKNKFFAALVGRKPSAEEERIIGLLNDSSTQPTIEELSQFIQSAEKNQQEYQKQLNILTSIGVKVTEHTFDQLLAAIDGFNNSLSNSGKTIDEFNDFLAWVASEYSRQKRLKKDQKYCQALNQEVQQLTEEQICYLKNLVTPIYTEFFIDRLFSISSSPDYMSQESFNAEKAQFDQLLSDIKNDDIDKRPRPSQVKDFLVKLAGRLQKQHEAYSASAENTDSYSESATNTSDNDSRDDDEKSEASISSVSSIEEAFDEPPPKSGGQALLPALQELDKTLEQTAKVLFGKPYRKTDFASILKAFNDAKAEVKNNAVPVSAAARKNIKKPSELHVKVSERFVARLNIINDSNGAQLEKLTHDIEIVDGCCALLATLQAALGPKGKFSGTNSTSFDCMRDVLRTSSKTLSKSPSEMLERIIEIAESSTSGFNKWYGESNFFKRKDGGRHDNVKTLYKDIAALRNGKLTAAVLKGINKFIDQNDFVHGKTSVPSAPAQQQAVAQAGAQSLTAPRRAAV